MAGMGANSGTRGCSSAWALEDICVSCAAPPASEPPAVRAALTCVLLHAICCNNSMQTEIIMHAMKL